MTRCDRLNCKSPVDAVLIHGKEFLKIRSTRFRPGEVLDSEDIMPITLKGFCEFCIFVMSIKFSTPESRWPEGAEL